MKQYPKLDFAEFTSRCEKIAHLPERHLRQGCPIWIFGAGSFGRDLGGILRREGYNLQGFIESSPRQGQVLELPVKSWGDLTVDDLQSQVAIGIFNRDTPLDELRRIATKAGFTDVFMPWDLYYQFGKQLGWRFWLSGPECLLDNLPALERTYRNLADDVSRQCLLDICLFRLGVDDAYAGFTHPDPQYFNELTLASLSGKRVCYVDGGAYNGNTFRELDALVSISSAYLFEPDPENFRELVAASLPYGGRGVFLPLGLADQYRILSFQGESGEGGAIADNGNVRIATVALDDVLVGHRVDFVKLDVEGAEDMALRGAAELIRTSRPILAVSLYHRPEDLWVLPDLLRGICESYRFYIRQHYYNSFDAVLYAIPI